MEKFEGEPMNKYKYLIAGGNSTLLVEGCPEDKKTEVVAQGLNGVEQVGFVTRNGSLPSLEMMGGELSVNGTLAFARLCGGSGKLKTSGIDQAVTFSNYGELATVTLPLPFTREGNIVLFQGIGFYCTDQESVPSGNRARNLASQYDLPAFGILIYRDNQIINPSIFVLGSDSFVRETACGSGSIALSIITGETLILQPSGQRIRVEQKAKDQFMVTAKVTQAKLKNGQVSLNNNH